VDLAGVPMLLWKLLDEISHGDRVLISRTVRPVEVELAERDRETALLLGAFVSEGWIGERRAGFNNIDGDFFGQVVRA
jgi:DNA gyrase subunit A